ncbi:MAG TPA: hypothetical protein DCQ88_03440, partial [Acidimicrobiaceae bacterium]|nr:hypothetical protein [Acidimicrobiaceae bacterium]
MKLTITASIHARWGHRVDDLIHTHAWTVEATLEGPLNSEKVYPADELEKILTEVIEPWSGYYLTQKDVGIWKGYKPLIWDREPTVEEITRNLWDHLSEKIPSLIG